MAEKTFPFINRGFVSKLSNSELQQGQLQSGNNFESLQEGSINSRAGRKLLGVFPAAVFGLRKFRVGDYDLANPRYFTAFDDTLWRTTNLFATWQQIAVGFTDPNRHAQRFSIAPYSTGAFSDLWAFLAGTAQMLKDRSPGQFTPQNWGILQAAGVCLAQDTGGGNLDGGAAGSPPGSNPYDWIFTYRNPLTGNEGNPSLSMLDNATVANGLPLALHNRQATITIWGALDPQMDNQNAIALYRRGGVFSDGLYRLVGYFQNPPPIFGAASPLTILDNKSDLDLVDAKTAEFDNDAPVTSRLQTPINATLTAFFSQAPGGGWHQFQIDQNFDGLGGAQLVKAGSVVQFLGDGNSENVVIFFVVSPNSAIAYFQYNHAPGEPVTMDSCANMACPYAYSAFDSIFLAGDPNNPHLLYKSKTGRPESFPLISSDGTANAIIVGSPDNPIMNITEFRDYMLCMNRFSFFVVPVISGQMLAPSETPAQRGLADPWAWTRGDNAIRYLGNDGFYAWDGGQSTKLSEAIDAFFHGREEGGLPPFYYGVTAIPPTRVEYVHNEVWLCFTPLSAL